MPNYNAPPGADDLRAFLKDGSFSQVPTGADLETPCEAALELFGARSGFEPFLGSGEPEMRDFDAPGPAQPRGYLVQRGGGGLILDLEGGILAAPTVTVDGEAMLEGEDFRPLPRNALAKGKPFTMLEWFRPVYSRPSGIQVLAPWGYCQSGPGGAGIPGVAWQGILHGAAFMVFYTLPNNPDLQSVSRAGLTESFEIASTVTAGQRGEALKAVFDSAWKKYRRAW